MLRHSILFVLTMVFVLAGADIARADAPRLIGTHNDWSSYVFWEDGQKVCFMASRPKKSEGNYTRRGEILAMITHRPAAGTSNVVSFMAGYTYKTGSRVSVKVAGKEFSLYTMGETAWAENADDKPLSAAIRSGSTMVVKGTSKFGTLTTDTYSLSGSMAAYNDINRECNVK